MVAVIEDLELYEAQTLDEFVDTYYGEEIVISESDFELLHLLRKSFTVVTGKKGSGKTMTAVRCAWLLKHVFGLEVVTDFRMRPAFGSHVAVTMRQIVDFLDKLVDIAEIDLDDAEGAEMALRGLSKKLGFSLFNVAILLDEAYKYADCRDNRSKVTKIFTRWISQVRHFNSAMIWMAPHDDMLDKRITRQIDFLGSCYSARDLPVCYTILEDLEDGVSYKLKLEKSKWGQLFESENKLGIYARL